VGWDPPSHSSSLRGPDSDRSRARWGGRGQLPTYLAQAIICAVLFNVVAGVVAIVYSVQVNRKLGVGDWDGAVRASRRARTWCWVSVAIGLVFLLLIVSGTMPNPYSRS